MVHLKSLGRATALAALLGGTAAHAQVTAEDVWKGWTDYYGTMGAKVTTTAETKEGDTLVIKDASFAGEPQPGNSFSVTIAEVRLKEMGDGTVEMTMSNEVPFTTKSTAPDGKVADMVMKMTQTDLKMLVSGTPADLNYDFTAPAMGVTVASMTVDGAPVPLTVDIAMTGNTGKYNLKTAAGKVLTSDFAADQITFNVAATDPEGTGDFTMTGTMAGLQGTSNATIPEGVDFADMNKALRAGMIVDGSLAYGAGTYAFDFKDTTQTMAANSKGSGGKINFKMAQDGLAYGGGGGAAQVSVTGSQIPFPVDLTVAESGFNIAMPVVKTDTSAPFAFLIKLKDLTVSDGLWDMVDPTKQLPRDPATVVFDASGMATLLVDIMDPANANSSAPPGTLDAVNLNALQVKVAGAELTGSGAATVDNSAGIPKPVGAVDLKLTGGNALIDKLVAMGLIPEDQAMGARMMMGMFAVPDGEDSLTSKIEFKEDGGIYANGQRIQ
jgi:Uncharacterized protein conserved in bacteria (DUF2125)